MTTPIIVRLAVSLAFAAVAVSLAAQRLRYPEARKDDHVDTYFGVKIADPYRWLEDENSADTARWVEGENKVRSGRAPRRA